MSFDWSAIKTRFEQGETAGQIAKSPITPTRQAINRRAKREGWERKQEQFPVPAAGTFINVPTDLEPRRRCALQIIAQGGTLKDAAAAAHVSESTFREWRKDPEYSALIEAAESGIRLEMLAHVRAAAATDPRVAQWWLSRHPASRSEFGDNAASFSLNTQVNILGGRQIIDRGPVVKTRRGE